MNDYNYANTLLEEQIRNHYEQTYYYPHDVTHFWTRLAPHIQEGSQPTPRWQRLFKAPRQPPLPPENPLLPTEDAKLDTLDIWAVACLLTVLIASMATVLNLAAAKGRSNITQVAGNTAIAGIYFTTSQDEPGMTTINRMDKTSHVILWRRGVSGFDSLVIVGDALYMSVYDQATEHGYIYVLNAKDGSVRWQTAIGPDYFLTTPAVGDGAVYVMQWSGKIYALDSRDGKLNWIYNTKHVPDIGGGLLRPGNIAVANGMVYDTILNTLFAVDDKTGMLRWSRQTGSNYLYGSPQVVSSIVYLSSRSQNNFGVGPQSGSIYAYDAKSGKQDWTHPVSNPGPGDPTIANGFVVFAASDVYALKASNGHEQWRYPVGQELFAAPYVTDGVVYEQESGFIPGEPSSIQPALLALNLATGTKRWSRSINAYIGAVYNGIIYAGLRSDQLATLRPTDGAFLWHRDVGQHEQQGIDNYIPEVWLIP